MNIVPLKLGAKFNPPKLALLYEQESRKFVHEFLIDSNELAKPTYDVIYKLVQDNPKYLKGIQTAQLFKFVELLKEYQQKRDRIILWSSDSDRQYLDVDISDSDELF